MHRVLVWMFTALVLAAGVSAQDAPIVISLPIHGKFAFTGNLPGTVTGNGDNQLFTLDTLTGEIEVLMERERSISNTIWNLEGNALALWNFTSGPALGIYLTESHTYSDILVSPDELFFPQSWSPANNQIIGYSTGIANSAQYYQLKIVSVTNGAISPLFNYTVDSLVTDIPLPPSVSNFKIRGINQAAWNPAYPEWILVQYDGYDEALIDVISGYPTLISPTFLYNLQTGEKLSINALFPDTISTTPIRWSPDGRFILLGTNKELSSTAIVRFENISGTWTLTVVDEIRTMDDTPVDWLGVSDLLLTSASDGTNDNVFNIAQIFGTAWHSTEFLRIPAGTFERQRDFDWYLNATQEEKRGLTCLFDSAQPSRLAVGAAAQVNFTNGTPLRLRTEPDFGATEITQMAEGTAFDVIGGPACVNGDSYYRFWQIELADGTIGWAAEADNDDYFMEPAED